MLVRVLTHPETFLNVPSGILGTPQRDANLLTSGNCGWTLPRLCIQVNRFVWSGLRFRRDAKQRSMVFHPDESLLLKYVLRNYVQLECPKPVATPKLKE